MPQFDQKLDRAGISVSDGGRRADSGAGDALANRRRQHRRRALLDDLLVATLRRTLALEQMDDPWPWCVGEHLHLDVPRTIDQALDVERAVAERRRRLASRGLNRRVDVAGFVNGAHAFAAAAGRRLDERRQPDAIDGAPRAPSSDWSWGVSPGTTGTPADCTRRRASIFEPIRAMTVDGGPTNTSPACSHAAANAAFSERNP